MCPSADGENFSNEGKQQQEATFNARFPYNVDQTLTQMLGEMGIKYGLEKRKINLREMLKMHTAKVGECTARRRPLDRRADGPLTGPGAAPYIGDQTGKSA